MSLLAALRLVLQRAVLPLAAPLAILAGAAWVRAGIEASSPSWQDAVRFAPWAAAGAGALLGVLFHRGRAFLALLALGLICLGAGPRALPAPDDALTRTLFCTLAYFVPVDLLLLSIVAERRAFSMNGLVRLSVIFLQVYVAWLVAKFGPAGLACGPADQLRVPGMARGIQVVCALLITARTLARPSAAGVSFTGALVACLLAIYGVRAPYAFAVYMAAAALIVDLGIILGFHELAYRDELTGLPGRRAFEEELAALGSRYCIAMLDVDHFKQFNDTYGHLVGDDVLRLVAAKLRDAGGGARAFRYGGEEFALVYRNVPASGAEPHLERLRETVAGYTLSLRRPDRPRNARAGRRMRALDAPRAGVRVTVSIGLAERSERLAAPHDVVAAADRALYRAKQQGRNRVCH